MKLTVIRDTYTPEGVYGELFVDGKFLGYTCEQPWRNNSKGRSCVPLGVYELRPWDSGKYGKVVVLNNPLLSVFPTDQDIPKGVDPKSTRTYVLIHAANYPRELRGCIAPGLSRMLDSNKKQIGVGSSRECLNRLKLMWGDRKGLTLEIKDR